MDPSALRIRPIRLASGVASVIGAAVAFVAAATPAWSSWLPSFVDYETRPRLLLIGTLLLLLGEYALATSWPWWRRARAALVEDLEAPDRLGHPAAA